MSKFDVWIIRFEPGDSSPAERLETAFGIDSASAGLLEQSVPKIVKHAVPAKAAGEMRLALEAIGAIVECRPAREVKPTTGPTGPAGAAVFRPPGADLFPTGRVSGIDPFATGGEVGAPRISVDEAIPPTRAASSASEAELPEEGSDSPSSHSPVSLRHGRTGLAAATVLAGVAILAIGYLFGSSVLRGEADWMGIGFDGLGIYFLGVGAYDLFTGLRS